MWSQKVKLINQSNFNDDVFHLFTCTCLQNQNHHFIPQQVLCSSTQARSRQRKSEELRAPFDLGDILPLHIARLECRECALSRCAAPLSHGFPVECVPVAGSVNLAAVDERLQLLRIWMTNQYDKRVDQMIKFSCLWLSTTLSVHCPSPRSSQTHPHTCCDG